MNLDFIVLIVVIASIIITLILEYFDNRGK